MGIPVMRTQHDTYTEDNHKSCASNIQIKTDILTVEQVYVLAANMAFKGNRYSSEIISELVWKLPSQARSLISIKWWLE